MQRGEVKYLRVVEETSRVSPTLMGGSPYNQVFLVSAALAFNVKNYLGVVPVEEDGSAYFEVPAGRGVFFHALDAEGRTIQIMRSFVQAVPGTTRSCIGCHEHKYSTTASSGGFPNLLARTPRQLQKESWGSGYVDYASMVQPILDKHCVSCHGGEKDIAAGMDLSGGWTEHFNISYENLANRVETQLTAYWIAGIDCMNGTAPWSCQIFPPRGHGSGAAPLAKLLVNGHDGKIPNLSRPERDLLMAWIDTNGLYRGNWDSTQAGCAIRDWNNLKAALTAQMQAAGCLRCHGDGQKILYFENDWINLRDPEFSRILRTVGQGRPGVRVEPVPRPHGGPQPAANSSAVERLCPRRAAAGSFSQASDRALRPQRPECGQPCLDQRPVLSGHAGDYSRRPRVWCWPIRAWTCRARRSFPVLAGYSFHRRCRPLRRH